MLVNWDCSYLQQVYCNKCSAQCHQKPLAVMFYSTIVFIEWYTWHSKVSTPVIKAVFIEPLVKATKYICTGNILFKMGY